MRATQRKRIKELHEDGFSISELAIMYNTSGVMVERVLEERDEAP